MVLVALDERSQEALRGGAVLGVVKAEPGIAAYWTARVD
jgi:hypothetical protein